MHIRALVSEIRRRKVFHVAVVYALVAIGVIEAADLLVPNLALPPVLTRGVVALALLGFPVALVLGWAYEWSPAGVRATPRGGPYEEPFVLDEDVCRRLDRTRLDSRVVGDRLWYLDNRVRSDTLFVYFHGLGHDAAQFAGILHDHPHRAVAPTLYGFEPDRSPRVPLEYDDHLGLMRAFLAWIVRRTRPKTVVVVGFSAGADVALRVVGEPGPDAPRVHGLLALGPNLGPSTLFATKLFARLGSEASDLPRTLSEAGAGAATLEEWLDAHEYLIRILRKFEGDVAPLQRFAGGLAATYERPDHAGFVDAYRAASRHADAVLCVVADTEAERIPLERIRLRNLDDGTLGDRFRPGSLRVESGADHFQLIDPARHRAQLEALFELMRGGEDGSEGPGDPLAGATAVPAEVRSPV